ncbi:MAG: sulfite oxidase [Bacteroidota bacterium]|nr:sulfite oxidase [Bacteroidota bacterium]
MQSNRRRFLKALAAGAGFGLVAGCDELTTPLLQKDKSQLIAHSPNALETRLENLRGFLTPVEHFFVRKNGDIPPINLDSYRLEVGGEAIGEPLRLSFDELQDLPSRTVFSYLECAGNQRVFFGEQLGQLAAGTQWGRGAVGMASWTGTPLADVLRLAGIAEDAETIQLIGLDSTAPEGGFRRPLPIDKAMDPDTLLAFRMNGRPLLPDHGFPVRVIVPGWVGSSCIKWLGRIEAHSRPVWGRNNTTSYVLIGDDYPPEGEASGQVVTLQTIKSALALPWPAQLPSGRQLIYGYAHSPNGPIKRVRWSLDEGQTWENATVLGPWMRHAWTRFEIALEIPAGHYTLTTSAMDETGLEQPESIPFNQKGYLFNMHLPHPIVVIA